MSFACILTFKVEGWCGLRRAQSSRKPHPAKPVRPAGVKGQVMIDAHSKRSYSDVCMRVLLAGLLLLCLTGAAFAQAEAEGEVESIGFGGAYRPNCWTAMKLRLRPKVGDTRTYKIAIVQEDLD